MKKIRLVCANLGSASAKLLAEALSASLGYKVWRSKKAFPKSENIIYGDQRDKLTQYKWFEENKLNFPFFTESKQAAIELVQQGRSVVCRTKLRGLGGDGIVIADTVDQIVDAPVYVEYHKKTNEYRVNMFKGEVVCIREKRKRKDYEAPPERDGRVRSHDNGYVFCTPLKPPPEAITELAKAACKITTSDIVGVDIAYHKTTDYAFLLEVNSAPGMEGLTIEEMRDAVIKQLGGVL
jgi:glutathione synthase/RimK-type ligase-like ATP-grasp enzyme